MQGTKESIEGGKSESWLSSAEECKALAWYEYWSDIAASSRLQASHICKGNHLTASCDRYLLLCISVNMDSPPR